MMAFSNQTLREYRRARKFRLRHFLHSTRHELYEAVRMACSLAKVGENVIYTSTHASYFGEKAEYIVRKYLDIKDGLSSNKFLIYLAEDVAASSQVTQDALLLVKKQPWLVRV